MSHLENLVINSKTESITNSIEKNIVLKQNIPNPASKVTTIEYAIPSNYKSALLNIYDIDGKTLLSQPVAGKSTFKFDLSTLASGTYVYTLTSNDEVIAKQKVIVKK